MFSDEHGGSEVPAHAYKLAQAESSSLKDKLDSAESRIERLGENNRVLILELEERTRVGDLAVTQVGSCSCVGSSSSQHHDSSPAPRCVGGNIATRTGRAAASK